MQQPKEATRKNIVNVLGQVLFSLGCIEGFAPSILGLAQKFPNGASAAKTPDMALPSSVRGCQVSHHTARILLAIFVVSSIFSVANAWCDGNGPSPAPIDCMNGEQRAAFGCAQYFAHDATYRPLLRN